MAAAVESVPSRKMPATPRRSRRDMCSLRMHGYGMMTTRASKATSVTAKERLRLLRLKHLPAREACGVHRMEGCAPHSRISARK